MRRKFLIKMKIWSEIQDKIGVPLLYSKKIDHLLNKMMEEENVEDYDDVQYINLVFPPGSNPPTRNSI